MKSYKGRGIVLHTLKYGDSSMIVYLLTDVGGRRSYMVQGVRSRTGRGSKQALLQPAFPLEFEGLEPSQSGQMHRFREMRSGFLLQGIPFDVRKSTMAMFLAEVIYRLVRESERNEVLFECVWNSVAALDALQEGVANFHKMIEKWDIDLPKGVCANATEEQMQTMIRVAQGMVPLWENCLGKDWQKIMTPEKMRALFEKM